jgi:hypothetical protein
MSKGEKRMDFFIDQFIKEKYEDHLKHEPQRKGTPRGEPIGFSRDKYKAMLDVMRGLKLKDVAKLHNISYQIVRRWNTEEQFQKAIIEHSREFAEYLISYLQKQVRDDFKAVDDLLKGPITKVMEFKLLPWAPEELIKDYKWYHFWLKDAINGVLFDTSKKILNSKKPEDDLFKHVLLRLIDHTLQIETAKKEHNETVKEYHNATRKELKKQEIDCIRKILLKKRITDQDRKGAMFLLNMLEQGL